MTRSVTIVNSSNWDNEPCLVNGVLLGVGEKITIDATKGVSVKVEPVETIEAPKPFGWMEGREEGQVHIPQVLPQVQVVWVKGGGMLRREEDISRVECLA